MEVIGSHASGLHLFYREYAVMHRLVYPEYKRFMNREFRFVLSKSPLRTNQVLGLVTTVILAVYAYWQLREVESGSLFAVSLAMDAPASVSEMEDARNTARRFAAPAVVVVIAMGLLIARAPRMWIQAPNSRAWRVAAVALLVAAVADAATTVHFFHVNGIDYELHPGIRLFGYAYGRTVGPILGKMGQLVGLLFLASFNVRLGTFLLWFVSALYVAAAIYNATTV